MVKWLLIIGVSCLSATAQFSPFSPFAPNRSGLLINQNFEDTGTPSGWTVFDADGVDFDNTSSPLSNAQDLKMGDAADPTLNSATFVASAEVWVTFEFTYSGLASANAWFYVMGASDYTGIVLNPTKFRFVQTGGVTVGTETTDALSTATKYYVFFHAVKGTGANAVYDVEFNTSNSRTGSGNKFTSYTSGTVDEHFTVLQLYRADGAWGANTWQIDNVKVSNAGWPP